MGKKTKNAFKRFVRYLESPKVQKRIQRVHMGIRKGASIAARDFSAIETGLDKTLGLPKQRNVNTIVEMERGVIQTLPNPRRRLGRVVVRQSGYMEKFW